MPKYTAHEDGENTAGRLIAAHHDHLDGARIKYLLSEEPAGKDYGGQVHLVGDPVSTLLAIDFIVIVCREMWEAWTPDQRTAAMDHYLCQCGRKDDKQGDGGKFVKKRPNYQEFTDVIYRHGFWSKFPEETAFAHAAAKQLRLPLGEGRTIAVKRSSTMERGAPA